MLLCCGSCSKMRKVKVVYDSNKEKIRFLIDKKNLADNPRHKIKID